MSVAYMYRQESKNAAVIPQQIPGNNGDLYQRA